ncbi:MAG: hypothetical protein LRY66_00500 [Saccharospirillaceae bacterium]|nr:hypothetical protein [Saccharospirillaceae bacterium]MCD8529855.1 hypothetical protein [Saccharospirillaceae bacterium]
MFFRDFINPVFFYILGAGMLMLSVVSAYQVGGVCFSEGEDPLPMGGILMSVFWVVFSLVANKIDRGYKKIRGSKILTVIFLSLFIFMASVCLNFVFPLVLSIFC